MHPKLIEIIPTLAMIENPEDINESTRIEQDLRIYGFVARRFLMVYSDIFDVNIAGFRFHRYFSGSNSFYRVYARFLKRKKNTLTMGDLDAAIPYKKLNEKVLEDITRNQTNAIPRKKIRLKTEVYIRKKDIFRFGVMVLISVILLAFIAYYLT